MNIYVYIYIHTYIQIYIDIYIYIDIDIADIYYSGISAVTVSQAGATSHPAPHHANRPRPSSRRAGARARSPGASRWPCS